MTTPTIDQTVTPTEAAELIDETVETLAEWRKTRSVLPYWTFPHHGIRYSVEDLEAHIAAQAPTYHPINETPQHFTPIADVLLNVEQAGEYLHSPANTLSSWAARGAGPKRTYKPGNGRPFYRRTDLDQWKDGNSREATRLRRKLTKLNK